MKEIFGETDFSVEIPMPYAESIDEKVLNKKIEDAAAFLKNRDFAYAYDLVKNMPKDNLPAQRIKFLSYYGVASERELSFGTSDIVNNEEYQNLVTNGSPDLIRAYTLLAKTIEQNEKVYAEIVEVDKLTKVKLWDDAIEYATKMTEKYPSCCLAWARLLDAKMGKKGVEVDYLRERALFDETKKTMEKMRACPDIEYYGQRKGKYVFGTARGQAIDGNVDAVVGSQLVRYDALVKIENYHKQEKAQAREKQRLIEEEKREKKKAAVIWTLVAIGVFAFMIITSVLFQSIK